MVTLRWVLTLGLITYPEARTDTGVDLEVRTDIDLGVHTDIEVDPQAVTDCLEVELTSSEFLLHSTV